MVVWINSRSRQVRPKQLFLNFVKVGRCQVTVEARHGRSISQSHALVIDIPFQLGTGQYTCALFGFRRIHFQRFFRIISLIPLVVYRISELSVAHLIRHSIWKLIPILQSYLIRKIIDCSLPTHINVTTTTSAPSLHLILKVLLREIQYGVCR